MNEQIQAIYIQMFAPDPIPEAVKEAFKRTAFLANRIDATMFRPTELAVIAGAAIQGTMAPQKAKEVSANKPIDTSGPPVDTWEPPAPDDASATVTTAAPEPPVAGQTPEIKVETPTEPETPAAGRTGIMDAPPRPDKKRRGLAATKMQKLTIPELRVHAEQVYGWKAPTQYKKPEIIAVLQSKEPLGT